MTSLPAPDTQHAPSNLVLTAREGAILRVTLNRPRAINALNAEMFHALRAALAAAAVDLGEDAVHPPSVIYLDGAGDRGFCGGGDIKELASADTPGVIFRQEYTLNHEIHMSPVPVVAIMDGVTMGGGIGLGGHAAFRIVTERSRLAMPEVRIGIIPDVGGHLLLANAPGRLGEYLALTAGEMNAADAIALGFADYLVASDRIDELRAALAAGGEPRSTIEQFARVPSQTALPQHASRGEGLLAVREWFDEIADAALGARGSTDAAVDPAAATTRLITALEASDHDLARETGVIARGMNPDSLAMTLAQLARTRAEQLDLAAVLDDDFRILSRIATYPNFAEGVRAQLIDKDRNPKWVPARVEDIDPGVIAKALAPYADGEAPLSAGV